MEMMMGRDVRQVYMGLGTSVEQDLWSDIDLDLNARPSIFQ